MPRGIFVSFEGSEGCGKSTQIGLLADRLKSATSIEYLAEQIWQQLSARLTA